MTEREFIDCLADALYESDIGDEIVGIRSLQELGLLTEDEGVVVRLENGDEFEVHVFAR